MYLKQPSAYSPVMLSKKQLPRVNARNSIFIKVPSSHPRTPTTFYNMLPAPLLKMTPSEVPPSEFRSSHWRCSIKKVLLKISPNLQENTCARIFFNKACEIFQNNHFSEHHRATASSCFP